MFAAKRVILTGILAALVVSSVSTAFGQGFLLPKAEDGVAFKMPRCIAPHPWPHPRPVPQNRSYKIKEVAMEVAMQDQVAKVQLSQTFVNTGNDAAASTSAARSCVSRIRTTAAS